MRKLIVAFLLMLCTLTLSAQYRSSVYGAVQFVDLGYGIGYDYMISNRGGFYSTLTIGGNYHLIDNSYIKNHRKFALGFILTSPKEISFLTAGVSYHWYGDRETLQPFPRMTLFPASVEVGAGVQIHRYRQKFTFDILKREGTLSFGYSFNWIKRTLR